jgi:hypothetical protein
MNEQMRRIKWHQNIAVMLVALAGVTWGCSNDEEIANYPAEPEAIQLTLNIEKPTNESGTPTSRMAIDGNYKSSWQPGDTIGLYVVSYMAGSRSELSPTDRSLIKLTRGKGGEWIFPKSVMFPTETNGDYSAQRRLAFYAFYPFRDVTDNTAIRYDIDTPVMTAKTLNVKKGDQVVLIFEHKTSILEVQMDIKVGTGTFSDVQLHNVKGAMSLNVGGQLLTPVGDVLPNVPMKSVGGIDNLYRLTIAPQTVTKGSLLFDYTYNGLPVSGRTLEADKTFAAGTVYHFAEEMQ